MLTVQMVFFGVNLVTSKKFFKFNTNEQRLLTGLIAATNYVIAHVYYKRERFSVSSSNLLHLISTAFNDVLNCHILRPGKVSDKLRMLQYQPLDLSAGNIIEIESIRTLQAYWKQRNLIHLRWNMTFHLIENNKLVAPKLNEIVDFEFLPKDLYYICKKYSYINCNELQALKRLQIDSITDSFLDEHNDSVLDNSDLVGSILPPTDNLTWLPSSFLIKI